MAKTPSETSSISQNDQQPTSDEKMKKIVIDGEENVEDSTKAANNTPTPDVELRSSNAGGSSDRAMLHEATDGSGHDSRRLPPRVYYPCNFCKKKFPTTQALGRHQNAHKHEREMAKQRRDLQMNAIGQYDPLSSHNDFSTSLAAHASLYGSNYGNRSSLGVKMDSIIHKPRTPWTPLQYNYGNGEGASHDSAHPLDHDRFKIEGSNPSLKIGFGNRNSLGFNPTSGFGNSNSLGFNPTSGLGNSNSLGFNPNLKRGFENTNSLGFNSTKGLRNPKSSTSGFENSGFSGLNPHSTSDFGNSGFLDLNPHLTNRNSNSLGFNPNLRNELENPSSSTLNHHLTGRVGNPYPVSLKPISTSGFGKPKSFGFNPNLTNGFAKPSSRLGGNGGLSLGGSSGRGAFQPYRRPSSTTNKPTDDRSEDDKELDLTLKL